MFQLIDFFRNNGLILLFLFLETIAFIFIIQSHSYHYSKYLNSANAISGFIHKNSNHLNNYFSLKRQNNTLIKENESLKNRIENLMNSVNPAVQSVDTSLTKYRYITAKVVNNQYTKANNILTIDKGESSGIRPNMGVVLSNGIVGITLKTSKHFTTVMSILNSYSKVHVKIKNTFFFGSIGWEGGNPKKVRLGDIPIQAGIQQGDTVVSGGKSAFFPEGIPIGAVANYRIADKSYIYIDVELFADFRSLNEVYVIENKLQNEQLQLEADSEDE